jgi:large subunit ribosomal protein L5
MSEAIQDQTTTQEAETPSETQVVGNAGENPMRQIKIEKITLNIGAGKDQKILEKGVLLIKHITGTAGIQTISNKRIPAWGVRPGLPVGAKLTIRGAKLKDLLSRLLKANGNNLKLKQFSNDGNFSFGIKEYIDIPGLEYEPSIGVMGLEVSVSLERPGFRVKKRRIRKKTLPKKHKIAQEEAVEFMKKNYGVEIQQ